MCSLCTECVLSEYLWTRKTESAAPRTMMRDTLVSKETYTSVKRGLIPMDTKDGVSGAAHHDARHTSVKRDLH